MEERWREPAALAEQYAGMLYRLAYARTGSRADAEDVMQEVFVRLLRARPEFRDEEHAKAWLLRVGARCAADVLRAPWRRREGPLDDALPAPEPPGEGGVVEAMGWNRYGGWRVGIRSFDSRRYYYYAHLQKDTPFAPGLAEGDMVQAGDVIGFMGRTGYSDRENVNNIETVHLHFGLELVFDESQKECNSEIWINVYDIVRLLSGHRSSIQRTESGWGRVYPYQDLDWEEYPKALP